MLNVYGKSIETREIEELEDLNSDFPGYRISRNVNSNYDQEALMEEE